MFRKDTSRALARTALPLCVGATLLASCTPEPEGKKPGEVPAPTVECDGFASNATNFGLPSGFQADDEVFDTQAQTSSRGCTNTEDLSFQLLDLNGNGKRDLVVMDDCDAQGTGTDRWLVYENTGSAFADSNSTWSLPSGFNATDEVFDRAGQTNGRGCANSEDLSFALLDLRGTGKPDLVVMDDCDAQGIGTERWLVYQNNGAGFDDSAQTWSLPSFNATEEVFDRLAQTNGRGCANSEDLSFALLDLRGTGKPDLVVMDDCDAQGIGTERWLVYKNTGSGFEDSASTWSLPSFNATEEVFDRLAQTNGRGCANSEDLSFALLDLQGTGKPDLVVMDDCDVQGTGTESWLVYKNTGSGFDSNVKTWALPGLSASEEVMDRTAQTNSRGCSNTEDMSFALLDLNRDRLPDFVLMDDCDAAGTGTDRWLVYKNTGSGFENGSANWQLPSITAADEVLDRTADGSTRGCNNSENFSFSISDVRGADTLDIVLTDDCDAEGTGTDQWLIWEATCKEL